VTLVLLNSYSLIYFFFFSINDTTLQCVDDCVSAFTSMSTSLHFSDHQVPPLAVKWVDNDISPLRVGVINTDGWFEPCGASKRAVSEAVNALSKDENIEIVWLTDELANKPSLLGFNTCKLYYSIMQLNLLVGVEIV
jgi:hypothetical protein